MRGGRAGGLRCGIGLAGWLIVVLALAALAGVPYDVLAKPGGGQGGGGGGGGKPSQGAVVQGTVWHDHYADGVLDSDDAVIHGWTVFADQDGDGTLDTGEPSAQTGTDGTYTLEGLQAGSYTVMVIPVIAGWYVSCPGAGAYGLQVRKGKAVTFTGMDFGLYRKVSVSGDVYYDLDGDGKYDHDPYNPSDPNAEPKLPGWTLYLDDNDNGALDEGETTAVSDEKGHFVFWGLMPGQSYVVREVVKDGWTHTSRPAYYVGPLVSATSVVGLLFGNIEN